MSALSSWRLALRLARREALRARGRSVLALVMIALPVLAVTAADVVIQTSQVSGVESLDRRLGSAQAQVVVPAGGAPVLQSFDPYDGNTSGDGPRRPAPTADEVAAILRGAPLLEERVGGVGIRTDHGRGSADATEVDLRDPLADGLVRLTSGRLPDDPGEVVVNQALLDKGYQVGDRLELSGEDAPEPVIVGVAESTSVRDDPAVAGPVGSLDLGKDQGASPTWLVGGGPVDWDTVRKLNEIGAIVLSRAVLENPPPESEIPEEIRSWSSGPDDAVVAVVVLVVVMALLEVVLLAGPAFAVSARRQARSLALMAATGGTPAQSRRVVLAGGLVLGGVAAALGVLLGIGAGWAVLPLVQRLSRSWFGPFDVPWLHLVGVAAFGLLSALLAAVVPAWIASRQDVVAVLAGRRADRPPSVRSPILGVLLLGAGVAGAAYGATTAQNGEVFIAGAAVVAVLGMILLVPVVVVAVANLAGRLPLTMRYAVRDAARHRTRTVPAVAAVAATVAGVVALGISTSSDAAESEATYNPLLPMGEASVTGYSLNPSIWDRLAETVRREVPSADVTAVTGVVENAPFDQRDARSYYLDLREPGSPQPLLSMYSSAYGASVLVGDTLPSVIAGISANDRQRAEEALARGEAVAFTDHAVEADRVTIGGTWSDSRRSHRLEVVRTPTVFLSFEDGAQPSIAAVVPPALAERLGVEVSTVSLAVTGADISRAQEQALDEAVAGISENASFYVERGYQADAETLIIQLVLAGMGAVLMLGGTLTATFLALSDARPDLATLSAIGASPRRRRGVAASYALVVGLVGAVLGAAVGFIPGVAITYPLTAPAYSDTGPFLDVPWLMILGLVVALPLVTALVVALCTRSRLPLVARLD